MVHGVTINISFIDNVYNVQYIGYNTLMFDCDNILWLQSERRLVTEADRNPQFIEIQLLKENDVFVRNNWLSQLCNLINLSPAILTLVVRRH